MTGEKYSQLYERSPEEAYRALFDEYCKYVYAIAFSKLRACGTAEDTEECVSDIFAEVFFRLDSEKAKGELKGFIATIAKRRAINKYYSLNAKTGDTVSLDSGEISDLVSDSDTEHSAQRSDLSAELAQKIDELGEPDYTIVVQRFYYERSSADIASDLGMKPSAVRMRSARAMKKLKKALEKDGYTL